MIHLNNIEQNMSSPISHSPSAVSSLPRWLKRNVPKGDGNHFTAKLIGRLGLQTVCEHARCPNRMECYAEKTATFMILGDICTRGCRFCSVKKGKPKPIDADEPRRVAEAAKTLGLKHVVVTCVTRDDLPDGGAEHFVRTIAEIRRGPPPRSRCCLRTSAAMRRQSIVLIEAAPDVYNHNTETVPRLFAEVRGQKADYRWTLDLFRRIGRKNPNIQIKTGLMLGLGETVEELFDTLADLLDAGCRMLTLGQYLQPSPAKCRWHGMCRRMSSMRSAMRPGKWALHKWPAARLSGRVITQVK